MNLICLVTFQLLIVDVTLGHNDFEIKKANYTPVRSHGKSLPEKEDISSVKLVLVVSIDLKCNIRWNLLTSLILKG